jgi:hypothetical protein
MRVLYMMVVMALALQPQAMLYLHAPDSAAAVHEHAQDHHDHHDEHRTAHGPVGHDHHQHDSIAHTHDLPPPLSLAASAVMFEGERTWVASSYARPHSIEPPQQYRPPKLI